MWVFSLITGIATLVSLAAAYAAERFLTHPIPLIGSLMDLRLSHNAGIAFGVRLPGGLQELLIALALIMVGVLAVRSRDGVSILGYGLIAGGGLGNVIDRIPDGVVTDFIRIASFPIFNVADSCISVGVAVLLLHSLAGHLAHRRQPEACDHPPKRYT